MYEKVKRFFDCGLYSSEQVAMFVQKGKLTEEDYLKITGNPYEIPGGEAY